MFNIFMSRIKNDVYYIYKRISFVKLFRNLIVIESNPEKCLTLQLFQQFLFCGLFFDFMKLWATEHDIN